MARPRDELLQRLAEYELPVEPVLGELREYGWDAEEPVFTITRDHLLNILLRYLEGELTCSHVTDWADLIECRDDLDYEKGVEDALRRAVFELANPNLTQPVTPNIARELRQKFA